MPREIVTLECTEAKNEGKPPSRYMTTRNKKLQTERVEKKKYNPFQFRLSALLGEFYWVEC